ncbi:MAG: GTP 3',8-cyclase MoaA [Acidobacteriota bacterium]
MVSPPVDPFERRIDYLRLSITDRCNLRCAYCMPESGVPKLDHDSILRYEEILRLARIISEMGISKIRLTGGEPLVRQDALYLCEALARLPGVESLTMTTNGVLLARHAEALVKAGLRRVNISLDTLRPERFAAITRADLFHEVWRGIMASHEAGLAPIKLNVVVMRGVNDDEIEALGGLTHRYPFHVRFIEFMPFKEAEFAERFLPAEGIIERLGRTAPLLPSESRNGNGPARYFRYEGAPGKIGIISPVSRHFCPACNRLRLTADGKLRSCLFSVEETDLRTLLRQGASDEEIAGAIRETVARKPQKHSLDDSLFRKCINRPMVAIGG